MMEAFDLLGPAPFGVTGNDGYLSRVNEVAPRLQSADFSQPPTEFSALLQSDARKETLPSATAFEVACTPNHNSASTAVAVDGPGFLVVKDAVGTSYLEKSGSFALNEAGELVDQNGNRLQAHAYESEGIAPVANDFSSLQSVQLPFVGYEAVGSTSGSLVANLCAGSTVVEATNLPSETSGANTKYSHRATIDALDNLGNRVTYDVFFSKTAENSWQMSIFNAAGRDQKSGSFPYAAGSMVADPIDLRFDPTGRLASPSIGAASTIFLSSKEGGHVANMNALTLCFAALTESRNEFSSSSSTDGSPMSVLERYQIGVDGTVYAQYTGGILQPRYQLALATVENADRLDRVTDSLLAMTDNSGSVLLGSAGDGVVGSILIDSAEYSQVVVQEQDDGGPRSQQSSSVVSTHSSWIDLLDVLAVTA